MRTTVFLLCALIFAVAHADYLYVTPSINTLYVGVDSDWLFLTGSDVPNTTINVGMTGSDTNVVLSTSTLSLSPNAQQSPGFKVKALTTGLFTVSFSITGDTAGQFGVLADLTFISILRPATTDALNGGATYVTVDYPSEPIKIILTVPSTSALTFTPTFNGDTGENVVFSPTTITIPAGSLSGSFTYMTRNEFYDTTASLDWDVSGTESSYYTTPSTALFTFYSFKRTAIYAPSFSTNTIPGATSGPLYFATYLDLANASLTVTPQAADTTFTPASVQFDSSTQVAAFNYTTSTTELNKPVYFHISGGAGDYVVPSSVVMNTEKRLFNIDAPTEYVLGINSTITVKIEAPVTNDITVTLFAANLQFDPASVTFSDTTTGYTIAVTPSNIGTDQISFLVTGTDVSWYTTPATITEVDVNYGFFFGPGDGWYVPELFVGQESPKIPIRLAAIPATTVSVTPSAPDMVFNPANLTFDANSDVEQYFTITPTLARANAEIDFLVTDQTLTTYSPSGLVVSSNLRELQAVWSSDIEATNPRQLYLQKSYTVWVSTNYVGNDDTFTVTPVSPYFTFNPSVLKFDSSNRRVSFTATPTMVYDGIFIDFVVSGEAAGYYQDIASQEVNIDLRPVYFSSAQIAWDNREVGYQVDGSLYGYPTVLDAITRNHVYAFTVATKVAPDSKVTITPKCAHVDFSPSSVTLGSGSRTAITYPGTAPVYFGVYSANLLVPQWEFAANFTATPRAPGIHYITFEFSNDDGPYYDIPDDVHMHFKLYNTVSSSSRVTVASSLVLAVVASLFLVL